MEFNMGSFKNSLFLFFRLMVDFCEMWEAYSKKMFG